MGRTSAGPLRDVPGACWERARSAGGSLRLNVAYLRWTPQRRARSVPGARQERRGRRKREEEGRREGATTALFKTSTSTTGGLGKRPAAGADLLFAPSRKIAGGWRRVAGGLAAGRGQSAAGRGGSRRVMRGSRRGAGGSQAGRGRVAGGSRAGRATTIRTRTRFFNLGADTPFAPLTLIYIYIYIYKKSIK